MKKETAHRASFRIEKSTTVGVLTISQPQRDSKSVKFMRFLTVGRNAGPSSVLSQQAMINFACGGTFEPQIKAAEDPNLAMIMSAFDRAFICEADDQAGKRISKLTLLWRRMHWLEQQDGLDWYSNELKRLKLLETCRKQLVELEEEAARLDDKDYFNRRRGAIKRVRREEARYMRGFVVCAAFSKLYEDSGLPEQRYLPTATQVKDCIKKFIPDFPDSDVGFFGKKLGLKFAPGQRPGRPKKQRPAGWRPPPRQRIRERPIRDVTAPMSKEAEYYHRLSGGRIGVEGPELRDKRTPLDEFMGKEDEERQS